MEYRPATPADESFLREMLWLAYNWRDQTAAADHWPDPDGPRRYVEGFGRPGDARRIYERAGFEPRRRQRRLGDADGYPLKGS